MRQFGWGGYWGKNSNFSRRLSVSSDIKLIQSKEILAKIDPILFGIDCLPIFKRDLSINLALRGNLSLTYALLLMTFAMLESEVL